MKNIHILPTDKETRLYLSNYGKELNLASHPKTLYTRGQHIYITSDEEIKEGDWCIDDFYDVFKIEGLEYFKKFCKKIILTTDQDLIKDGVQSIDDKFLEWFVKNPSCKVVKILRCPIEGTYILDIPEEIQPQQIWNEEKMEGVKKLIQKQKLIDMMEQDEQLGLYEETKCYCGHTTTCDCGPEETKQECMITKIMQMDAEMAYDSLHKQETLEEAAYQARRDYQDEIGKDGMNDCIMFDAMRIQKGFKLGARWQQERSYSEEEVLELLKALQIGYYIHNERVDIDKWFEQFKKK